MKYINEWIHSILLVLFPADPEFKDEGEKEEMDPVKNFIVLIMIFLTIGFVIVSAS